MDLCLGSLRVMQSLGSARFSVVVHHEPLSSRRATCFCRTKQASTVGERLQRLACTIDQRTGGAAAVGEPFAMRCSRSSRIDAKTVWYSGSCSRYRDRYGDVWVPHRVRVSASASERVSGFSHIPASFGSRSSEAAYCLVASSNSPRLSYARPFRRLLRDRVPSHQAKRINPAGSSTRASKHATNTPRTSSNSRPRHAPIAAE